MLNFQAVESFSLLIPRLIPPHQDDFNSVKAQLLFLLF